MIHATSGNHHRTLEQQPRRVFFCILDQHLSYLIYDTIHLSTLIMDPISIASLVATTSKIIECCASAGFSLREIKKNWDNAPALLDNISRECSTIESTMKLIQDWLLLYLQDPNQDEVFLNALCRALYHCAETSEELRKSTAAISPHGGGNLHNWRRFKISSSDKTLRNCRDELRWQALAVTNLHNAFNQ